MPSKKLKCHLCGIVEHFAKLCKKRKHGNQFSFNKRKVVHNVSDVFHIFEENFISKQFETIVINGTPVNFMIDTGATVSLLPTKLFEKMNLKLNESLKPN